MINTARSLFLFCCISLLFAPVSSNAQSTYGQARLKCKECLLIQVLNQANVEFKEGKFDNAIPYFNLYLTQSGDKNPVVINNLAESYWQKRSYQNAADWYSKIGTPEAKQRLNEIAAIQRTVLADANLKFYMRDNIQADEKPADALVAKDKNTYTINMSCAQQYRVEVCGANIIINSSVPAEAPPVAPVTPKEPNVELTENHRNIATPSYIIHFDFDSYRIGAQSYKTMDSVIHDLEKDSRLGVVLVGHTDLMGSELYNERLAINRSDMAETYLMSVGMLDKKRIIAKAFGKRVPLLPLQKPIWENRRVEIYFIKYGE